MSPEKVRLYFALVQLAAFLLAIGSGGAALAAFNNEPLDECDESKVSIRLIAALILSYWLGIFLSFALPILPYARELCCQCQLWYWANHKPKPNANFRVHIAIGVILVIALILYLVAIALMYSGNCNPSLLHILAVVLSVIHILVTGGVIYFLRIQIKHKRMEKAQAQAQVQESTQPQITLEMSRTSENNLGTGAGPGAGGFVSNRFRVA